MKLLPIFGAATACALAVTAAVASTETAAPVEGSVKGRIVFDGKAPEAKPLPIKEAQAEGCCAPGTKVDDTDRSLLVDEKGGIANVVVGLTVDGFKFELPKEPVLLDQEGCRFSTVVLPVHVGTTVAYGNSDSISHNVHTYATKNEGINKTVAAGTTLEQKLEEAEAVRVACDIHPWMEAHVYVTESTHFTVTGRDGSFELPGVPAGEYKLEIWHAKLGKGKGTAKVAADGSAEMVEIKMGEKKKGGRRRR